MHGHMNVKNSTNVSLLHITVKHFSKEKVLATLPLSIMLAE